MQRFRSQLYSLRRFIGKQFLIRYRLWYIRQNYTGIEKRKLAQARQQEGHYYTNNSSNPLVSVVIPTFNRGHLLVERTIPSVQDQTYQNFEIVIVGDGCTDATPTLIQCLNDERIRFFNLSERGKYPTNRKARWQVAGVPPMNRAHQEAKGLWLAHLDDDDVFEPDHIESLLGYAQRNDLEFVYSQKSVQGGSDRWQVIGKATSVQSAAPTIGHSSVFFRRYLRLFEADIDAWRLDIGADSHMWLRMIHAGVNIGFLEKVTARSPLRPGTTTHDWFAEDRT